MENRLTIADKKWLACALDSEGFICLRKTGYVVIGITNTNLDFLAECKRIFPYFKLRKKKLYFGKYVYEARIDDIFSIRLLLKILKPYLIIKKIKLMRLFYSFLPNLPRRIGKLIEEV